VNSNTISKVTSFKVLNLSHCRHFPIQVKLVNKERESEELQVCKSIKRIVWDADKYEEFGIELDSIFTNIRPQNISEILKHIYHSASKCGLIKEIKLNGNNSVRGPVWFNNSCKTAKRDVLHIKLKILRKVKNRGLNNFQSILNQHLNSKTEYKEIKKAAKSQYYLIYRKSLETPETLKSSMEH